MEFSGITTDVIENRLLVAALSALGRLPLRSDSAKRELLRAQRLFGAVKRVHFSLPCLTFSSPG
jgi:hypothetical protein